MSRRALELAEKKQRLQARSAELRQELAGHVAGLSPLEAIADAGVAGVSWLRRNPAWAIGAAVALVVAFGPRRVLGLGMRMWGLGQIFLGLRSSLTGLMSGYLSRLLFRNPSPAQADPP